MTHQNLRITFILIKRHDAVKLSVTFGLSQNSKSIPWHSATDLKPKFSNYHFEASSLNREVSHILTSMKREIRNAFDSKPKEDTQYDDFKIQHFTTFLVLTIVIHQIRGKLLLWD